MKKIIILVVIVILALAIALFVFFGPAQDRVSYHEAGDASVFYCIDESILERG